MNGFNVNLGANTTQFTAAMTRAEQQLQRFPRAANSATTALTNLGRVAQDAPYGFIGIANNLNPLLESFQRLKVETGSTSGALKSLGSSLMGAGGVGIALSVVSSLAIVFGDRLFGAGRKAKELKEENEKLAASISGDIVQLTSLVAIITNVNTKQSERLKALAAVNQEYGTYIKNLGLEKATLENIETAYNGIIDALLRQAVVKGLQEEIEKAVRKTAASIIALKKSALDVKPDLDNLGKSSEAVADTTTKQITKAQALENVLRRQGAVYTENNLAQIRNQQITLGQIRASETYEKRLEKLKEQLRKDLAPLFEKMKDFSFDDLNIKLKELKVTPDKLTIDLSKLKGGPILDGDAPMNPDNFKAEKFSFEQVFYSDIKAANKNIEPFDANLDNIVRNAMKLKAQRMQIGKLFGITDDTNSLLDDTQKSLVAVGQLASSIFVPAFEQMANAVFEGKNAFEEFGRAVANALKQIFAQLAGKAALAGILTLLFPGGIGGAKGFGAIFKNLLGFADGGIPPVGRASIVGERGPELFIPSVSGRIVPNHQLGGIAGSGRQMIGGVVTVRVRGRDLLGVLSLENAYQERNG